MESAAKVSVGVSTLKDQGKYTWDGVLDFLDEQERGIINAETERSLERQELHSKLASLESELRSQENINRDLLKRVKMLEFALRQEQIRNGTATEEVEKVETGVSDLEFAKERAKQHREMLKK
eukprot:TRINITY_DN10952_c0_g1_i7.p2 TRINITY_DN10952_c0_g1~~TRINITY_DN10952_c0_g1_i7.p2  ORF type:complete len:123 (-),score=47.23 TRINITY_DN10952_c0_g1_i7:243-611(-)